MTPRRSAAVAAGESKYRNRKTVCNGITFDSAKEARRYADLVLAERSGEIVNLERQARFSIEVNRMKIATYIADFTYELRDGTLVVEDVKSPATRKLPAYRLKKKLMLALYQIEIQEV